MTYILDLPINIPIIGKDEIHAVVDVLESGILTSAAKFGGPAVRSLENIACKFTGSKYTIAVNSGTASLQCALHAFGIGLGDEVLLPSFTFVATANAVIATGATPVFVDILHKDFTIDLDDLRAKITTKSRAIIPVHLYGRIAHMDKICKIASENNLKVIEDAAQALGSKLDGRYAGTIADAGCFSMYPGKIITSGEGGLLVTDDEETRDAILKIRNHGMVKGYDTETFGLNLRMPEIAAAIGRVQFGRLLEFIQARTKNAKLLTDLLNDTQINTPMLRDGEESNWSLYTVTLDEREKALKALRDAKIGAAVYYPTPVHRLPFYTSKEQLPVTDWAAEHVLSLPIHPNVKVDDLERIANILSKF
ncbi:MAG: pyridoxal-5'-phosphate-dependent protein [Cenarchaeum symbiont of Oopsacas minuta]|nr:pyridoxal-5'-phosphate-dependent protein [Cenarchaeum symbiont of Oopsacas minuta]